MVHEHVDPCEDLGLPLSLQEHPERGNTDLGRGGEGLPHFGSLALFQKAFVPRLEEFALQLKKKKKKTVIMEVPEILLIRKANNLVVKWSWHWMDLGLADRSVLG